MAAVKLTGADLNAFMTDKSVWKEDHWYDDAYVTVNGKPDDLEYSFDDGQGVPPDAKVTVEGGCFYTGADIGATFFDLDSVLRKWLKARTVVTVTIEVPKTDADAFCAEMKARKWRVLPA